MDLIPSILHGSVMHARLFPAKNAFKYRMYYLAVPLSKLGDVPLSSKRFSWMSFRPHHDHGYRDGRPLQDWVNNILNQYAPDCICENVTLFALPRIFGYVFNPVSFYVCHDKGGALKAVICEVNNTFGETHTYVCQYKKNMQADKVFHVSPFIERNGHYDFKFEYEANQHFAAFIDYYHDNGEKQLVTYLKGDLKPMTRKALLHAFFSYPLVTFKAITLIHYQAIKLLLKKVKYIPKPKQKQERVSVTKFSD